MASAAGRNPYTTEDDEHLAAYLAAEKPTAAGRNGNATYKALVEQEGKYPWSSRHSWQSWRDRYVKNHAKFDYKILKIQKASAEKAAQHFTASMMRGKNAKKVVTIVEEPKPKPGRDVPKPPPEPVASTSTLPPPSKSKGVAGPSSLSPPPNAVATRRISPTKPSFSSLKPASTSTLSSSRPPSSPLPELQLSDFDYDEQPRTTTLAQDELNDLFGEYYSQHVQQPEDAQRMDVDDTLGSQPIVLVPNSSQETGDGNVVYVLPELRKRHHPLPRKEHPFGHLPTRQPSALRSSPPASKPTSSQPTSIYPSLPPPVQPLAARPHPNKIPRKVKKGKDDDFFASSSSGFDSPSPPPPTRRRDRHQPELITTKPPPSNTLKRARITVEPPEEEPPAVPWPPPRGNTTKGKARMIDNEADATISPHPASKRRKLDPGEERGDNDELEQEVLPPQSTLQPTPLHQEASLHIQSRHGSATRQLGPSPVVGPVKKHTERSGPPEEPSKAHKMTTEAKGATKATPALSPSTTFAAPPVPGPSKARDIFDKDGEVKQVHVPRRATGRGSPASSSSSNSTSPLMRRPDPPTVDLVRLSLDRRAYRRSLKAKTKVLRAGTIEGQDGTKTKETVPDSKSKGLDRPSGDARRARLHPNYRSPSSTGTVTTGATRTSNATRSPSRSTSSTTHPAHAGLTRDQVKMMEYTFRALGVAYGVDAGTVRDLYHVTMDIEKTVEVLGVMGRAADRALQRAICGEDWVGGGKGPEPEAAEREAEGHGDTNENERPATPGSGARSHSQSQTNTPSRRRRSSRHSLTYRIPSPTTEALLLSQEPYSPPDKSRAGEFARLERQGRVEEAFEREKRRASGGVARKKEPEDGRRVVWGHDGNDDDDGDGEEEHQDTDLEQEHEVERGERRVRGCPSWRSWKSGSEDEDPDVQVGGGRTRATVPDDIHSEAQLSSDDDDDHDSFDDMYIDETVTSKIHKRKEDDAGAEADTESVDDDDEKEDGSDDESHSSSPSSAPSSASSSRTRSLNLSGPLAQPYPSDFSRPRSPTPTASYPSYPISSLETAPKLKNGITTKQLEVCFERIGRNEKPCREDDEKALVELVGQYRDLVRGVVRSACVKKGKGDQEGKQTGYWNPVAGKDGFPGGIWLGGKVKVKQEADERDGLWGDEEVARPPDAEAEEKLSTFLSRLDGEVVRLLTLAWMFEEASAV